MITVTLKDGLGNQLFQYAAGKQLAIQHKTELRLRLSKFARRRHRYGKRQAEEMISMGVEPRELRHEATKNFIRKRLSLAPKPAPNTYIEPSISYDPKVEELPDGTHLTGLFQSERYFQRSANEIRASLNFDRQFVAHEDRAIAERLAKEPSIGLHVRCGDYLLYPIFQVCTKDYYYQAVKEMRAQCGNLPVYLFSNDLAWCRQELKIDNVTFIESPSSLTCASYDLKMMSLCHHQIISNSTYSWWAAWLNKNPEKVIMAPYRWFSEETKNEKVMPHILPESWITINF